MYHELPNRQAGQMAALFAHSVLRHTEGYRLSAVGFVSGFYRSSMFSKNNLVVYQPNMSGARAAPGVDPALDSRTEQV